jgi:Raf kinase inhibitor-like YbhB/YbcL family protein
LELLLSIKVLIYNRYNGNGGGVAMILMSNAFKDNENIPARYTCDGEDISPALEWRGAPEDTMSYAIIVDDPDAYPGAFTHWIIFDIPDHITKLREAIPTKPQLPDGSLQGKNDFGRIGYGGPCPPHGDPHHYQFTLYALDRILDLREGASKRQMVDSMKGHILAQVRITGLYGRE